jgi:hypothetical protein
VRRLSRLCSSLSALLFSWRRDDPVLFDVLSLADLAARTDTLQIACTECDRVGRYPLDTLIQRYGSGVRIPDLLRVLSAGCPMRESVSPYALCGCHVSEPSAQGLRRLQAERAPRLPLT